jgi:beta-lactamase class A
LKYFVNEPTLGVYDMPKPAEVLSDELLYGMNVVILETQGEWVYIDTMYRYKGYCLKKHLISTETEPNGFINSYSADIMTQAKYSSIVMKTLPKGAMIELLESEGNWTKVQLLDGQIGYIRNEHVTRYEDYLQTEEIPLRKQIVYMAMEYMGCQYRWGGKSSWGIDCSGLTSIAYLLNGIVIYRDAEIQEEFGMRRIELEEIKPADLIYFPGHVAMYIGGDRYVHATGAVARVVVNSLNEEHADFRRDLKEGITGIARIIGGVKR